MRHRVCVCLHEGLFQCPTHAQIGYRGQPFEEHSPAAFRWTPAREWTRVAAPDRGRVAGTNAGAIITLANGDVAPPTGDDVVRLRRAHDLAIVAEAPDVAVGPLVFGGNGAWLAVGAGRELSVRAVPSLAEIARVQVERPRVRGRIKHPPAPPRPVFPKAVHEGPGGYIAIDAGWREYRYPFELVSEGRYCIHYPAGNRLRDQAVHLAALEEMCRAEPEKWRLKRRDRGARR